MLTSTEWATYIAADLCGMVHEDGVEDTRVQTDEQMIADAKIRRALLNG